MTTHTNHYENAEAIAIGTAPEIILGEKNFALVDSVFEWPIFWRFDLWWFCDDESAD